MAGRRSLALFSCLVMVLVSLAAAAAPKLPPAPAIVPEEGSENPVAVGRLAVFTIQGVPQADLAKLRVLPFPRTADVSLMKAGGPSPDMPGWLVFGDRPLILFRAETIGQYLLGLQDSSATLWTEYVVEVQGPIPPPVIVVEPAEPFLSSGKQGGPFEPRLKRYEVTASGNWTAQSDAAWVSVLGGDHYAELLINPEANKLPEGEHRAVVSFVCGAASEVREVLLAVGSTPPPPPPPPVDELYVVAILEEQTRTEDLTPQQAFVLTSDKIANLVGRDHFHVRDKDALDQGGDVPESMKFYIARAKEIGVPAFFIVGVKRGETNGLVLYEGDVPADVPSAVKLIEGFMRQVGAAETGEVLP